MKKARIPEAQREIIQNNRSLLSYLQGLAQGRPSTPHSWLYEHEPTHATVARWIRILKRVNRNFPLGEEFTAFDVEKVKRIGAQGGIPPFDSQEVQDVIEPVFQPLDSDDERALEKYWKYGEKFCLYLFGKLHFLDPMTPDDYVEHQRKEGKLNTNSGYPYFATRSTVVERSIARALSGEAHDDPAIVLFRFYRGKLRPVWMYPFSMNILEGMFEVPLKQAMRTQGLPLVKDWISPWEGFEHVKRTMTKQYADTDWIVGGDTTKMDAHMRKAQLRLFYELIKHAFKRKHWRKLYEVIMQVTDIPLLISTLHELLGPHGLASGSGWTQTCETVLVLFIAWINGLTGQGIGDDFTLKAQLTDEEVVELLLRFLLPANPDKQSTLQFEVDFLQRKFDKRFFSREDSSVLGAYYSTVWALIAMLQPENFHNPKQWNVNMFCSRIVTIAENCVDDYAFPEFVKFIAQGHPALVPFAKKTDSELRLIQEEARKVRGLFPSYNQEKKDKPLSDYVTIKLLRSL